MGIRSVFLGMALMVLATSCASNEGRNENNDGPLPSNEREMHNHSIYEDGIDFANNLWEKPQFKYSPENDIDGIKGMYLRSDYLGNESYAFCYLGYPEEAKENYPAILLLHGGGGTAYYEWVKKRNEKGFVALAIDLEGHVPLKTGTLTSYPKDLYLKSQYEAPHNINLGDGHKPINDTWLYYACKTAIIGNSFLHSLEHVDKYNVGVCGISWGGFITSIISGYDDRFAFSIPIYCTIGMENSGTPIGSYISNNPSFKTVDNLEPLTKINTPIYLMVSNSDMHENISVASDVVSSIKNGCLSIIDKFPHSHFDAVNQIEPYIYANKIVNKEKIGEATLSKNSLTVQNIDPSKVLEASIYETDEVIISPTIRWIESNVDLSGTQSIINLDINTTYSYASIVLDDGLTVSSNVLQI